MTAYKTLDHDEGYTSLAANGSSGDSYTFTVPNTSTDSICCAWAVRGGETGAAGLSPAGLRYKLEPTSFGYGTNGAITSVTFTNQAAVALNFETFRIVYMTPA